MRNALATGFADGVYALDARANLWGPNLVLPWSPAGAVTGVGAAVVPGPTLAGVAAVAEVGLDVTTLGGPTLAGTTTVALVAAGAASLAPPALSGTATLGVQSALSATASPPALSAAAGVAEVATGAPALAPTLLDGVAQVSSVAALASALDGPTMAGLAPMVVSGESMHGLVTDAPTAAGATTVPVTADGDATTDPPVLDGEATIVALGSANAGLAVTLAGAEGFASASVIETGMLTTTLPGPVLRGTAKVRPVLREVATAALGRDRRGSERSRWPRR